MLSPTLPPVPPVPPWFPGHEPIGEGEALWTAWSFDPEFLLPVGFAVFFYLRGLRRWEHRSHEHPPWRTALYLTGIAVLVLSFQSPIDRIAQHHFSMHMAQHLLTMTVAVPLILLGAPTTPSLRGMPRWLRLGVVARLAKRPAVRTAYGVVTHPVIAIALPAVVLWLWHLAPGWYDRAVEDDLIHDLQHMSFVAVAVLFWWNVIDPKPLRARVPHIPRILYILGATIPAQFLGAMLTFAPEPLYETYVAATPIYGLDPLQDQQLGGLLMWIPGGLLYLLAAGVVFAVWAQQSERRQRALEAAQDAERLGEAARATR